MSVWQEKYNNLQAHQPILPYALIKLAIYRGLTNRSRAEIYLKNGNVSYFAELL
jgi:hypothetical protein